MRVFLFIPLLLLFSSCAEANILSPENRESIIDTQNPLARWTASAILRPIEGKIGNGFLEAQLSDKLVSTLRMTLSPGGEEQYYKAWLVNDDGVIDLGTLESPKNDGTYFLIFRRSLSSAEEADILRNPTVLVTREPGSEHIASGTLTIVQY